MAVRLATRDEVDGVASVLADAFSSDPVFCWVLGAEAPMTPRRLAPLFAATARAATRKDDHLLYTDGDGRGAALWRPIDQWKIGTVELMRMAPSMLRTFARHSLRGMGVLSRIEAAHPTAPHYYLEFLGTRSASQGKGVGAAMIAPMLERCDNEGVPAYLESSNPRNIPFYARHGFTEREVVQPGRGAPTVTTMWREPR